MPACVELQVMFGSIMRTWYPALVAATILCVLWCVFMYAVFPIGPIDGLYGTIRPQLTEVAGDEEARRLMPQLSRQMAAAVQASVVATAVPLLSANLGWGYLAYRLLRKSSDLE